MTDLSASFAAAKDALRRAALARRSAIAPEAAEAAAEHLAGLAEAVGEVSGRVVAAYLPIRGEIDPRPLMRRLEAAGARLALPVVAADRETLIFRAHASGDRLEPASFGLSVPSAAAAELDPDVLLLPLAAFDRRGGRIGYGKGHYDRALARLDAVRRRRVIGLAFLVQEVDAVPVEPHDRPLDLVLTDAGPIRPAAAPTE